MEVASRRNLLLELGLLIRLKGDFGLTYTYMLIYTMQYL